MPIKKSILKKNYTQIMMNVVAIFLAQLFKKNNYGALVRKTLHNVDKKFA
jgi:hypothetical protein